MRYYLVQWAPVIAAWLADGADGLLYQQRRVDAKILNRQSRAAGKGC
jgi:predicted transcriptional regulator